ncbi:hypothetical protein JW926_15440 [Candidatus Sumerlaeota bacterium]|nr:hypothetical protein [Candidatus Sumerlaeota bacterium]
MKSDSFKNAVMTLILISISFISFAGDREMELPFTENFSSPDLAAGGWIVDLSEGNSIEVRDGALVIDAWENTYAHIERPLGCDSVRVSCEIKPGFGVSWATSIILYWDVNNWTQFSILLERGGTSYCAQMVEGIPSEHRFSSSITDNNWKRISIALGEESLHYCSISDGENWKEEGVTLRPKSFKNPPSLLIAGKGYGQDKIEPRYPAENMDNDYADKGRRAQSMIRNIRVNRLDPNSLTFSDEQKRELLGFDILGEKEIAAPGDPVYESISRYFPGMKFPKEAIGVKEHRDEFAVLPDGSLKTDGTLDQSEGVLFLEFADQTVSASLRDSPCCKKLVNDQLPVVIAEYEKGNTSVRQTYFGWSKGMSPDEELFVYIGFEFVNRGETPVRIAAALRHREKEGVGAVWEENLQIDGKKDVRRFFKTPFMKGAKTQKIQKEEYDLALRQTVEFWEKILQTGTRFVVPEKRVNDAYRAWLAYNFLDVDKRNGVFEPHDGNAGFYDVIYGYSAAVYCIALDMYGFSEEAQKYLDSLATFISEDGLFEVNSGLIDMPALLVAMDEHYRYARDQAWLERIAPDVIRMSDWIIRKRRESMMNQKKESPIYGLIKYRPYCDYIQPTYSYLSDAFLCMGLEAAGRILHSAGMEEKAKAVKKESLQYREAILRSMSKTVIERDGSEMLPLFPETAELLKVVGYTARDYYTLVGGIVLETGFLPPDSRYAFLIRNLIETRGGLLLGVCTFKGGIDHAYTYGYWMNCMERGEAEKVILGLYASMAYGMSRETYSAVEVTQIRTGSNEHTLPHLYSNTQQLRILRNMLVREDGNKLILAQAVPRHWLEKGKSVEVRSAPTHFGEVSYRIVVSDQNSIDVRLEPPKRQKPEAIHIHLRHPEETFIKEVIVIPDVPKEFSGDTIILKSPHEKVEIKALY